MKILPRFATLLLGIALFASNANAQTQLGQPTLDEAKTQIWCATARFVYEDTGVPELKSTLRCDGSLQAFENSIKADKQSVYSRLYKPLEGRGAIYNGLTTDPARLTKLTTEIINRLKNPARTNDPVRMQRLTALETGLKSFVQNGTPLGDTGADLVAQEAADTASLADTTVDSDVGVALPTGTSVSSPRTYAAESTMSKLFAPIALVFSLLSLVLFALQRSHIKALNARAERHRAALEAVKLAMPSDSPSLKKLTPELQREIEKVVEQRVATALAQTKPAAQNLPPRPAAPAPQAQNRPPVATAPSAPTPPPAPARPVAPVAAAPAPPPAPQQAVPVPPAPAPTYTAPAPMAEAQVAPPAPVIPAGPPAAAPRDDFDSLVPPVQLPTPDNWSVAPLLNKPENQPTQPTRYYVKVPVNGGFSEYDLQEQPQHDSIYEIKVDAQRPERATFRVTSNTAVHAYAIQSAQYSLREACRYQQPSTPVSRIVTDEEGTLFKSNGAWQIEQKAAIHFE
ncbi:hypothetical protein GCM10011375_13420 [Hymenobacter qilianensis]|uniref:Uncharacterized protein n=2 Tax=Hymenobacter qilianensis TaxID=1385715 RepID=A0ACB5PPR4_9BACT|nr:hypothetical protein [Hymenobacter qilianensis]QNP53122.1 hypothetical protein H9L05_05545 [Hymenobacter qilianensis]GGF59557.1 hypothetical protein GCM10011375_13420 [Hymenobacter qilianensis]